jgi:hypothetical protein
VCIEGIDYNRVVKNLVCNKGRARLAGLFLALVESYMLVGINGIKARATNCVGEKFK